MAGPPSYGGSGGNKTVATLPAEGRRAHRKRPGVGGREPAKNQTYHRHAARRRAAGRTTNKRGRGGPQHTILPDTTAPPAPIELPPPKTPPAPCVIGRLARGPGPAPHYSAWSSYRTVPARAPSRRTLRSRVPPCQVTSWDPPPSPPQLTPKGVTYRPQGSHRGTTLGPGGTRTQQG